MWVFLSSNSCYCMELSMELLADWLAGLEGRGWAVPW